MPPLKGLGPEVRTLIAALEALRHPNPKSRSKGNTDVVLERRKFIEENALDVKNLDI
jgi:hypothetical protein